VERFSCSSLSSGSDELFVHDLDSRPFFDVACPAIEDFSRAARSPLSAIVVSLLAAIGCGSSTTATGDGRPLDAAVMTDAAVMADAAVQGDAGEILDATMGDAGSGGDSPDTMPPGPVTDLRPRPGPRKIGLTWTNPHDDDLETVAIRWSVVAMPQSPDAGVPVQIRPGIKMWCSLRATGSHTTSPLSRSTAPETYRRELRR
jgi:hypothetical protein